MTLWKMRLLSPMIRSAGLLLICSRRNQCWLEVRGQHHQKVSTKGGGIPLTYSASISDTTASVRSSRSHRRAFRGRTTEKSDLEVRMFGASLRGTIYRRLKT